MHDIEPGMRGLSFPAKRTGSARRNNNIALTPAMPTSAEGLDRLVQQSIALLDVAHQMMGDRGFQYCAGGSSRSENRGHARCREVDLVWFIHPVTSNQDVGSSRGYGTRGVGTAAVACFVQRPRHRRRIRGGMGRENYGWIQVFLFFVRTYTIYPFIGSYMSE